MAKTICNLHWDYFLLLEEDLIDIFKYVEPVLENSSTYSSQIAKLFLAICSEIDVSLRDLMEIYSPEGKTPKNKLTIADYRDFVKEHYESEFRDSKVRFLRTDISLSPWEEWWGQPNSRNNNPKWWMAYNNIKHNRASYYADANFFNLLNAFSALFIVNVCIFRAGENDIELAFLPSTRITEFDNSGRILGSNNPIEYKDGTVYFCTGFHSALDDADSQ